MNALSKIDTVMAIATLNALVDLYQAIGVLDAKDALRIHQVLHRTAGWNASGPDRESPT